jgi:predicted O-methyltransferase YrrM
MTKSWQEIPGWFDWEPLYRLAVQQAAPGALFVEVGTWLGRSTACLAQLIRASGKSLAFCAVDHCLGVPGSAHYDQVVAAAGGNIAGLLVKNLHEAGVLADVTLLVADSVRAAQRFAPGTIDFAFIDGAHDYDSVRADLRAWWPRIRPGGLLAGHDYTPHWPDVARAVHEHFRITAAGYPLQAAPAPSCWLARKASGTS